jgi:hypothetical protein
MVLYNVYPWRISQLAAVPLAGLHRVGVEALLPELLGAGW